jgi:hypothetical protein
MGVKISNYSSSTSTRVHGRGTLFVTCYTLTFKTSLSLLHVFKAALAWYLYSLTSSQMHHCHHTQQRNECNTKSDGQTVRGPCVCAS